MKRIRKANPRRSGDWKAFLIVSSIAVIPLLATVGMINVSARQSLAFRTFPRTSSGDSAIAVDWPTLDKMRGGSFMPAAAVPKILESVACVPGYMIQFDDPFDQTGRLARFLLVPDPGNWLHPPHLDDGEVVIVHMRDGARTPLLDRKPVCVEGKLSLSPVMTNNIQTMLQLEASSVHELGKL